MKRDVYLDPVFVADLRALYQRFAKGLDIVWSRAFGREACELWFEGDTSFKYIVE